MKSEIINQLPDAPRSTLHAPRVDAILDGVPLRPGLILSMSTRTFSGRLIRMALGKSYEAVTGDIRERCPNHDAIVIEHDGELFIGDAISPKCRRTTVWQYLVWLRQGHIYNLRVFEVFEVTPLRQAMAAKWWDDNVANGPYDFPAFFRLGLKAIVGDWFPKAAGLRWAHWCTESVKDAYALGAAYDFYENANPTPLTTIKRWKEGRLKLLNIPSPLGEGGGEGNLNELRNLYQGQNHPGRPHLGRAQRSHRSPCRLAPALGAPQPIDLGRGIPGCAAPGKCRMQNAE